MKRALGRLIVVAVLAVAGCGTGSAGDRAGAARVLAATSLSAALVDIQHASRQPAQLSFAGSQALVAQVEQGAPAEVIATADTATMARLSNGGRLATPPQIFAENRLAIVVAKGNPRRITGLADLARPGLVVVLAAPAVPAGRYAGQVLARARIRVRPSSLEENVGAVVTRVALGEADAGVVYVTDVADRRDVSRVDIPADQNIVALYPIALLRDASHPEAGRTFIDFVLSPTGQRILRQHGFLPVPGRS